MPNCGHKVKFKYQVSSELVDEVGCMIIERKGKDTLTVSEAVEIKEKKATFKWPDLKKDDGTYYGGRKVDWKGLNKLDFNERFKYQKFQVLIQVPGAGSKTSGKKVKIDPYPDAGAEERKVGVPLDIHHGPPVAQYDAAGNFTGISPNFFPDSTAMRSSWVNSNIGHFWIEFKEGQVIITVKVNLESTDPSKSITDAIWNHFKNSAEQFWNGRNGFRQWVFHSKACRRKDNCNCSVLFQREGSKRKEKFLQGGCCKFPTRVNIEKGNDNTVKLTFLTPHEVETYYKHKQFVPDPANPSTMKYRANTTQIFHPEERARTNAHEVGHMMGLPDEYTDGGVAADQSSSSPFPITDDSIMGNNMSKAHERHLNHSKIFIDWVDAKVTSVKVIKR